MTSPTDASSRRWRLRRSMLFVPGSSEKMLAKAARLGADEVVIDLEDAVAPSAKAHARQLTHQALADNDWSDTTVSVRVNDTSTDWTLDDLAAITSGNAGERLDCVMLPKVESAEQVGFLDTAVRQLLVGSGHDPDRAGLEIQIETARGLIHVREILAASDRIEAVTLGPGDMAADLRMPALTVGSESPDYPGDHWHGILTSLLVEARAAGVQVIDGPCADVRDSDGFFRSARRSRALGFDGKLVLHPDQVGAANEAYGTTQEAFAQACGLLDAYATAIEQGTGAILHEGAMIDEAVRRMAQITVTTGLRQGLTR